MCVNTTLLHLQNIITVAVKLHDINSIGNGFSLLSGSYLVHIAVLKSLLIRGIVVWMVQRLSKWCYQFQSGILVPEEATSLEVGATTSDTDLVLTWTAPTNAPGSMKVFFGNTEADVAATATTHTFSGSQPGESGVCKVVSYGGSDCETEEASVELAAASCATKDVIEFTEGPVTSTDISFTASIGTGKSFSLNTLPTVTPGPLSTPPSSDPEAGGAAASSYVISATGLTPFTKYTFTFSGLTKGTGVVNDLMNAGPSHTVCTGKVEVSRLLLRQNIFPFLDNFFSELFQDTLLSPLTEDHLFFPGGDRPTNLAFTGGENEITISWTNPTTDPPAIFAAFDNNTPESVEVSKNEHTLKVDSSEEGTCKVIFAGTDANAECTTEESIPCKKSGEFTFDMKWFSMIPNNPWYFQKIAKF